MAQDFTDMVNTFLAQEGIARSFEGRRGVETLCQLAAALGYKDPTCYGQLTATATLGDLICMLEDNSSLIEHMVDWVKDSKNSEFKSKLAEVVDDRSSAYMFFTDGECPDCGEMIPDDARLGDNCLNCGHVFFIEE